MSENENKRPKKKTEYINEDNHQDGHGGYSAEMKRNIRRVFWLYFMLFAVLVVYIFKFTVFDSKEIMANSYNPRLKATNTDIKRGDIKDSNGIVLAQSVYNGDGFTREYPMGDMFAHAVGYSQLGKSGVELKYNFQLEKLQLQSIQRFTSLITGDPLKGNDVHLTIDAGLQELVYNELGTQKGAVVVMEPSTGKILSMVSYPTYDPNTTEQDWDYLSGDVDNSPLLNRASQGLYPPGSIFKILTSAAAYENMPNYDTYTYDCEGSEVFGEKRIRCFNSQAHGHEDIKGAFTVSCNSFYSTIGTQMGGDALKTICEKAFFNTAYPYPLEYAQSSFPLDSTSSESEVVETSIGQGKTLVTPLHMAMITSAVANGGIMMQPYVLDHVETYTGRVKDTTVPKSMGQVFTLEESAFLNDLMKSVVASGTGVTAQINGVEVAGKTGTAENASGAEHGWFVAYAPADNPQVAVSIVLENSGGPYNAMPMAKNIMEYVINN